MTDARIVLTGFMGVGKSSVSRHLAHLLRTKRIDLDALIESTEGRTVPQIIDADGIERYREIETANLETALADADLRVLSLGGGAWTIDGNRELLKQHGFTSVWLEATFEHCWLNITFSRKDRPLARDKAATRRLFDERQQVYCLAEWHFVIRAGQTSFDVAKSIVEELCG
ncbi:MAG TPA: shikimate kinase [Pyrinomonadaceae bacterium]|jgi:shikimate kinase|nr:shikimate kinase [Pyrinomonadaceae bacterium]